MLQPISRVLAGFTFGAALLQVVSAGAAAGTTGFVSGTIFDDKSHEGIKDEIVTATSASAQIVVRTDQKGNYSMMSVPPDVYVITAKRPGYETTTVTGVHVTSDQLLIVDLDTAVQD